jgi:hypothetical protein
MVPKNTQKALRGGKFYRDIQAESLKLANTADIYKDFYFSFSS